MPNDRLRILRDKKIERFKSRDLPPLLPNGTKFNEFEYFDHGFGYGASKVSAVGQLRDGTVYLQVQTPRKTVDIIVSPTGRLQFYDQATREYLG